MAGTIDMQQMRYINLFSRTAKVSTKNCFTYNNQIFFAVPRLMISKAIGKEAINVKKLKKILGKPIRIIAMPSEPTNDSISLFIKDIVDPIEFNKVEIGRNMVTITAGRQSKAALIGRNRMREKELSEIIKNYFSIPRVKIA